ncbi:hypothetical protein LSCM1_01519 [Leishmania martiniquensis]|uniref:Uncharacterized protein n=1 Tax=Leishmania martiniquensis TaxID=1580590 RepID=A0A836H5P9_9TRYP|nr:hypothetical protein LSCM1_01519 [Leishmania martiniquensis]
MDTTPAWLVVVLHNKQRYCVPVNAAGMQVGPPVPFRNANRYKRGGYGPGTVDGPSSSPSPLPEVSDKTDGGAPLTSARATPLRGRHCRRAPCVRFTGEPAGNVDYSNFLRAQMVTVTAAVTPQPSILQKSSGFPRALPPLFDFEYEPPHTPRRSPAEAAPCTAPASVSANGGGAGVIGREQANGCVSRGHMLSAAGGSQHLSLSEPRAHHPPRKDSDPSLRFVMDKDMEGTAMLPWAVHQLRMPESKPTKHLVNKASEVAAEAVPSTPTRPPSTDFGARSTKAVPPNGPHGAVYIFHGGPNPVLESHVSRAERAASRVKGSGMVTDSAQRGPKPLKGPCRTKCESSASVPRAPRALPLVVEENEVGQIASDLAHGTHTFYRTPSLDRLSLMCRDDAAEDKSCGANPLPVDEELAARVPTHRTAPTTGIECRMGSCFYATQTSPPESEARAASRVGNSEETRRNGLFGAVEDRMGSSALWGSQTPSIESKGTPTPRQRTAVLRGTPTNLSPSPTDPSVAEYEYMRPSTPIAVSFFAVSPPLCVEGSSRASLFRSRHTAVHGPTPRKADHSVGMWGRRAMLTLQRRFAYTRLLRPMPNDTKEEPPIGYGLASSTYGESTVSESPRSTEALTPLATASPGWEPSSGAAGLRSIAMGDFEDTEDAMEMVAAVASATRSSLAARPSPPQLLSGCEARHQSRWSSIRERLKRPPIPVSPDRDERRLPSLLQRSQAAIKAAVKHFAQRRSSCNSCATPDPLRMHRRPKKSVK